MADKTFGQILFERELPDEVQKDLEGGPVDKRTLSSAMTRYAKKHPDKYPDLIQRVKKFGDDVATYEGISVGLDDIQPEYEKRDKIIQDALERIKAVGDDEEKRHEILIETQDKILEITKQHPSDMALMARSGGRGSMSQLMKMVGSPVVATGQDGTIPWLITKSYSEGLKPSETWVAGVEARRNAHLSTGSVVEPGAVAKVIVTNMEDLVITKNDCKTDAGVDKPVDSEEVIDRYLAKAAGPFRPGQLVDPDVVEKLEDAGVETIQVRSPMTCDESDGVCQLCMGLDAWGNHFEQGTNVGSRSAQALTEPLTQFALNAKHGVRLAGGRGKKELRGLGGFRTLTEVPKSFQNKAALAKEDGVVTKIEDAPQGGVFVYVNNIKHYAVPGLDPIVELNQRVEKGDALTEGPPMPNEVVEAKGVGEGRRYMAQALKDVYQRTGADIDARHTELLARKAMNFVRVERDPTNTFIEGDTVSFNKVRPVLRQNSTSMPLKQARGRTIAAPVLHYTEGTRITPSVIEKLESRGINSVRVTTRNAPEIQPIMKSVIQTPLLRDDWMSRMSHRYLKKTLMEGAGMGLASNLRSSNPVPAYVMSNRFGQGPGGKYAAELSSYYKDEALNTEDLLEMYRKQGFNSHDDAEPAHMTKKVPERSKTAAPNPLNLAKRLLVGTGDAGVSAATPRIVGRSGGVDQTAIEARRWRDWLGEDRFQQLGLFDEAGELTDEGLDRYYAIENMLKGPRLRDRLQKAVKREDQPLKKTTLSEQDKQTLEELGVGGFSDEDFNRLMAGRGNLGTKSMRLAKGVLIGDSPYQAIRQRFNQGGLLGKGGLVFGDLGLDPDMVRSMRRAREGKASWGEAALPTLFYGGNLGLAYGLPGYAIYKATQQDPGPNESKWESVASPAGDLLGWSIGGPLGLVGGGILAGQIRDATQNVAKRLDPNYVYEPSTGPKGQQNNPQRGLRTYAKDLWRDTHQAMGSSNLAFLADTSKTYGGRLYNQSRQMYNAYRQPGQTGQPQGAPRQQSQPYPQQQQPQTQPQQGYYPRGQY